MQLVIGHEPLRDASRGSLLALVVAKCKPSNARMNAVGSNQQIDRGGRVIAERHVHGAVRLLERCDRGAESDRISMLESLVQDPLEVATKEVEMSIGEEALPQRQLRHREALTPGSVHEREAVDRVVNRRQVGQQAQTFGGIVARPEEVDHVACVARNRGACSTTSGCWPRRSRHHASVSPAIPAPQISTLTGGSPIRSGTLAS